MSLSPADLAYQEAHIDDNLQPSVIISTEICLSAGYIAVVLRFVSRRIGGVPIEKDDYAIVIALIVATVFSCLIIFLTTVRLSKHAITLNPSNAVTLAKTALASETILNAAIVTAKLFILLLYHRIFRSPGAFVDIFQCVPVRSVWDPTIPHTCVNFDAELIAISVLNVVSDVLILCLPLPMLWGLHTSTNHKVQLIGMFMMGILVCVGSIVRAIFSSEVSLTDPSWGDTKPAMWSMVETNLAIVSACLPTYRPLAKFLFGDKSGNTTVASDYSKSVPLGVVKSVKTTQHYNSNFSINDDRDFIKLTSGIDVDISAGNRSSREDV